MDSILSYIPFTDQYHIRRGLKFAKKCASHPDSERNLQRVNAYNELLLHMENNPYNAERCCKLANQVGPGLGYVDVIARMCYTLRVSGNRSLVRKLS